MSIVRSVAVLVVCASLTAMVAPGDVRAFVPPGEGFATSARGHVAILTPTADRRSALRVSDPKRKFAPPETIQEADFVAVGPRGDALVVGHERVELPPGPDGELNVEFPLWAAYRPPGGPVGAPVRLGLSGASGENWPALGIDASGTAVVLWSADAKEQPGEPMMASIRQPSGEWLPAQNLGGTATFRPALSVSGNGLMTATWRQTRPDTQNGSQAAVTTRLPGGLFGPATVVAGIQRDPGEPIIASNSRGDAVVAWIETFQRKPRNDWDIDTGFEIHGAFRKGLGDFGRPQQLSDIEAASPTVTVAESGRMTMAWAGNQHVEARVRSASGKLHPARRVTHDRLLNSSPTVLPTGRGLVAWVDRDPGISYARIASARADGRFGKARTITRARDLPDPPLFVTAPDELRFVSAFGGRGRSLLETRPIPRR